MADIRVKDLTEATVPGPDYYLLTDSATDGVKKVQTKNVVKPADIGAASLTGVETLTNKTIDASNNTVSNLTTSMFATNVVDNDGTLAANSSTRVPTQAAVKAYADQVVAATDAMVFKGVIDCSTNPNYPAADRGWTYKVSVAGKIGGASGVTVEVGDTAMCLTDGTASGDQATVGANWNIVQANLVGAVTGPASSTSGNIATFNGTGGTVIQDGGKALPSGALVGTSDTQTLTGKTLDTASNTFNLNGAAFGTATQATAALNAMIGDSGLGGTKGLVPAPAAGDAAASKFLKADGSWASPASSGVPAGGTTGQVLAKIDGADYNTEWVNQSGGGVSDGSVVFAGVPDCRVLTDAAITASSNVLTSATAGFTSSDVGKAVSVAGAGASGNALVAPITGFTNSTTVTLGASATATVSGARLAVGTDNSGAMGTAVSSAGSGANVIIPNGSYLFVSQISLPQGKRIRFSGSGAGTTTLYCGPDVASLFNYTRTTGQIDAIYEFYDLAFYTVSLAKKPGSYAIFSQGFSDAASLNMLRVHRCWFSGWEQAISSKWTGQSKVHNCYFTGNRYSVYLLRGCSFWDFDANMSGDATFLYAVDTTHDAFSNGLFIRSSHGINCTAESIMIEGYQAVWISQSGYDLGSGGTAAINLNAVMDFTIEACYISSNNSTTRYGVFANGCVRGHIAHNTIVNNRCGVQVVGVSGTATRITTLDNTFDGNDQNDVVWSMNATCCKHIANHHSKQMSRTGTNFEFYGNISGVDYGIINQNTFHGTSYTITAGANTQQANNIFGVTAG